MASKRGDRPVRVVLYEPSGLGGICQYTHSLAEALVGLGCRVTLVTASENELDGLARGYRTIYLFRASRVKRLLRPAFSVIDRVKRKSRRHEKDAPGGGARTGRSIQSALRSTRIRLLQAWLVLRLLFQRPDIVHLQSVARGRDLFLVRLLTRFRIPAVYTAHDVLPHDLGSAYERKALSKVYHRVDRVIVHAERNRDEMVKEFAVDPSQIAVIPHGSYDFLFSEGRVDREKARLRLGLPAAGQIVLFFGLIKRYKGLEYLIEAFRIVEKAIPDARLAIVGALFEEVEGYGFYRGLLEEASRNPKVICVPQYVPLESVGLYFCAADAVVLPYTNTCQSGVLLAAYAAGRPVVVTDVGGLPEVVEEGQTGFVVPPRDAEALGASIIRLLGDGRRAAQMGSNALLLAQTRYAWERIASETIRLYQAVRQGSRLPEAGLTSYPVQHRSGAASGEHRP